ncbi:hypothetical protein MBAV_002136 [Candidatus Magnetobacterium bavaricum]|uniref:Uncharacterized protein n=1 Tax=Candidatus Magnetobacterium bavaricum TaxID=29290 RepID=A0A0F3GY75_9BACT|nr:hypothetical protein MBAV_002136 [Candidatus Magnetobacterium bavaricum]
MLVLGQIHNSCLYKTATVKRILKYSNTTKHTPAYVLSESSETGRLVLLADCSRWLKYWYPRSIATLPPALTPSTFGIL